MEGKNLCFFLFFAFMIVTLRGEEAKDGIVEGQNNVTSLTKVDLPQAKGENVGKGNETHNVVVVNDKKRNNGGAGGGGGVGWGWGGGGGGANRRGGWGWGNGGGGGVYWRWGCGNRPSKRGHHLNKKRHFFPKEDYKIGEFAQCMVKGRCKGLRLDCPLHCGGPCFYDCRHMCKAHCKR